MEGAPLPEKKPEVKKASVLVRAAALVGMASAAVSPLTKVKAPNMDGGKKLEITMPVARPEDNDEITLKNKIQFSVSEAPVSEGQSDTKDTHA